MTVNIWNTQRASSRVEQLRIDDLASVGEELTDEDLRLVAGGFTIILDGGPTGAGTCTFDDDIDMVADS
jgi:hypothetical protein